MTSLVLADTGLTALTVDALIVGLYEGGSPDAPPRLAAGAESVDDAFDGDLAATLYQLGANGSTGEVTRLATLGRLSMPVIGAVGLGKQPADDAPPTADTLRRAAGAAVRALAGTESVALALPLGTGGTADRTSVRAVAEGALLGGYRFVGYATKPKPGLRNPVDRVTIVIPSGSDTDAEADLRRVSDLAAAVCQTRDWVNTPPNQLRPPAFADSVASAAGKVGLDVEVLDEEALRAGGYGGILAVGSGSAAPPRLVRLAYRPSGEPTATVALVGKGITFDSGGVSIKPAQGMWDMKSDMGGAAAIAGTMLAVAALKPSVQVIGYLPMAENMPSGTSYLPGDVVTMYGGKRVEVLNTDAEGRMVLADAIVRACEDEPDYLLETSTLTGGQITALGKRVSGVMGSEELCARVREAGDRTGEPVWPMPLPDDIRKIMESDVADILQVGAGMERSGHMLQGGTFLAEFVADGVPWVHIDVAGPAYHTGEPYGYVAKGGTGVPVRTLIDLIEDIAANG